MASRLIVPALACGLLSACASPPPQPAQMTQNLVAPATASPSAGARSATPAPGATPANALFQRTAVAGVPLRAEFFAEVNPDCTTGGLAKVSLETNPSHGSVTIQPGDGYTNFPPSNQRYVCNQQKVPGILTDYTAAKGYSGIDTFTLSIILPSGEPLQRVFIVNVRPQPQS